MTVQEAKRALVVALQPTSPTPQLDADCILQHVLCCDKTQLLLRYGNELTLAQQQALTAATARRKTGLPIAYITGHKEFFGYDFTVSPAVLIPKPDTELLVELALAAVEDKRAAHPDAVPTVCDMCTGSGCVGLSLLRALTDAAAECEAAVSDCRAGGGECATQLSLASASLPALTLADISAAALTIARTNAKRLLPVAAQSNVHVVQTNLFEQIPHIFDIIVTNPPYVPRKEALALLTDGRSEPLLALDGDVTATGDYSGTTDGLALIRRLVPQAYAHLASNGVLLMETGEYNAEAAAALCEEAGFRAVHIERDLSGQLRVVCACR